MNRLHEIPFRLLIAAIVLCSCFAAESLAQTPSPSPSPSPAKADTKPANKKDENKDPFALEPPPALPPGMTGSDTNDPRAKLKPGVEDAGEAAVGMKHLLLVKKPTAFQLGSNNPDDPKVQTILG